MHRKVRGLSDKAFRLHVSAVCWCNAHLTDGRIPSNELRLVSDLTQPGKYAVELAAVGLWNPVEAGWEIHDFLDFNQSAERVRAERERAKQKRQSEGASGGRSGGASAGASAGASEAPSFPVLSRPSGGAVRTAAAVSEVIQSQQQRLAADLQGFNVAWNLTAAEWLVVNEAIDRCGIPAMVACAQQRARANPPGSASAWVPLWASLPQRTRLEAVKCSDHLLPIPCRSCAADRKASA
jgi:hypothetical protein